jgi:hypothetical protein
MTEKCDVCGSDDGIECEVLLKGDQVDRIYHLCPVHWVSVYRKSLDDFLEGNEYKTNQYIKMAADKLIGDGMSNRKIDANADEDGAIDIMALDPTEIRKLRPYAPDAGDADYE